MFGKCIGWCEEETGKLDYSIPVSFGKDWNYKVLANLNCWDLLTILESDYNRTEELLELCYHFKTDSSSQSSESDDHGFHN